MALPTPAPLTGLHRGDFYKAMLGPALASVVMLLAMFGFAAAVDPLGHGQAVALVLTVAEALVGALAYGIVLLLVDRDRRHSAMRLVALAQASLLGFVLT